MTELELMNTLFSGLLITIPVCFFVLLFATRNYVLVFFSVVSIVQIVGLVLGTFRYLFNWDLGIIMVIA